MSKPDLRVQGLLDDERVQRAIPNLGSVPSIESLRYFAKIDVEHVKQTLHSMAKDLYSHLKLSEAWGQSCRDGHNDLLWFINRANLEKPTSPATAVRTAALQKRQGLESELTRKHTAEPFEDLAFHRHVVPARFGCITDFEDLFYMIWHKIKTVYRELQLRYKSRFLMLTDVVHYRGPSLNEVGPLTVADLVTMLQMWWAELTDGSLLATLHAHLRARVVLPDLVPEYVPHQHTAVDEDCVKVALQDRKRYRHAFAPGLKDLNTASPVTIIDQVFKKHGIILDCEKAVEENDQAARDMRRAEMKVFVEGIFGGSTKGGEDVMVDPKRLRCSCDEFCACRDLCTIEPDDACLCAMRTDFYKAYEADRMADAYLEHESGRTVGEHYLFGACTNEAAQMTVAAAAFSGGRSRSNKMAKIACNLEFRLRRLDHQYVKNKDKPLPTLPGSPTVKASGSKAEEGEECETSQKRSPGLNCTADEAVAMSGLVQLGNDSLTRIKHSFSCF